MAFFISFLTSVLVRVLEMFPWFYFDEKSDRMLFWMIVWLTLFEIFKYSKK